MAEIINIKSGEREPEHDSGASPNGPAVKELLLELYRLCLAQDSIDDAMRYLYLIQSSLREFKVVDEELLKLPEKVQLYFIEKNNQQPSSNFEGCNFYGTNQHIGTTTEQQPLNQVVDIASLSTSLPEQPMKKYTDDQIARALVECCGKKRVINVKWKWAGAYWYLRWRCNYPVDPKLFSEKIDSLDLDLSAAYECSYDSIRKYCNLSFMNYSPLKMDEVKVSREDQDVFAVCREVVIKLVEELEKASISE